MNTRLNAAALVLISLFLCCGSADAGGFSIPDFGARRVGMLAVTAKADDATAIFHNPAGLTLDKGSRIYYFQSIAFSDLYMKMYDSQGNLRPEKDITPKWSTGGIPFLGFTSDFGTERFRFGIAAYAPNAFGAAFPDNQPTRYHATTVLFLGSRATAAAAWEFSDRFSLGASFSLVHLYLTAERYMNPMVLADPDERFKPRSETREYDALLELDGQDLSWAFDIGMMFRPTETLRLGMSFASGSEINLKGDVKLTWPDGRVEQTTHHTQMVIPFTLRGGFNWEFAPNFEVGMDIMYWHYQVFQEQLSVLESPIMGMTEFRDQKNYGNSWDWSIGLLHRLTPDLDLMTGFQMDFTPIPDQTYTLDNPSRDQFGLSGGFRWRALEHHSFSLVGLRNWVELANVQTSQSVPPSNAKGHAINTEVGLDYTWHF